MNLLHLSDIHSEQHKKCVERIMAVALPRLQYRVANPQSQHTSTILQTRTAKNGYAIFGFGRTHAPEKSQGLDRKNTIVGKCRGKAATANNGRFGASGAMARLKVCANLEVLRPSERQWKPRHCAKPLGR